MNSSNKHLPAEERRAVTVEAVVELAVTHRRALRPLIAGHPLRIQGCRDDQGLSLWVVDHTGAMTMQARVGLKQAGTGVVQ